MRVRVCRVLEVVCVCVRDAVKLVQVTRAPYLCPVDELCLIFAEVSLGTNGFRSVMQFSNVLGPSKYLRSCWSDDLST